MGVVLQEIQNRQTAHLPASLLPEISYSGALNSHFTFNQMTYIIGKCPNEVFKQFIEKCGQASLGQKNWKEVQHTNLLLMLDNDCSDVMRWYAIELLLEQKVAVPLERNEAVHP